MATGKRASMREGPLADLFRKTATDRPAPAANPEPVAEPPGPPAPMAEPRRADRAASAHAARIPRSMPTCRSPTPSPSA